MIHARFTDQSGNRQTLRAQVRVESYSHASVGGPKQAKITLSGTDDQVWQALDMLDWAVTLHTDTGSWRWGGYVESVSVTVGAITYGLSLKTMANRIQVTYTDHTFDANGQEQTTQAFTLWGSDSDSIARYGTQEARLSFGDSTEAAAESFRDIILAQAKEPIPTTELADPSNQASAVIECVGWWTKGQNRYYAADMLLSGTLDATPTLSVPLYSGGSYPAALRVAQKLTIPAGSALAAVTVVAQKVGSPTGALRCEAWRAATGDDPSVMLGYVDVSLDELPDDKVAATITLDSVTVSSNTATATKTAHGLSVGFDTVIAGADLPYVNGLKTVVAVPDADHFTFAAAGADGTASGTITATTEAEPPPADPVAVTFNFPNLIYPAGYDWYIAVSLDAMTLVNASNYVNVMLSPNAGPGGLAKRNITSGWTNLDESYGSLRYQVVLTQETTAMIAARVASHITQLASTLAAASGIYASPYEDGQSRVGDTIEALLQLGSTTSGRLLARVSQELVLLVTPEPLKTDDPAYYRDRNGRLTNANGVPIDKSTCPVGVWVEQTGVPARLARSTRVFIEECEYNAITDELIPHGRGSSSPWSLS